MRKLVEEHGFTIANLSSRLIEGGEQFEYRMTIKSRDRKQRRRRCPLTFAILPEVDPNVTDYMTDGD